MRVNRPWLAPLVVAGASAALAALFILFDLSPNLDLTKGAQALAIKAAAGDTNAAAALKSLGPEAVPDLLCLFEHRDRFWRKLGWELAPRIPRRFREVYLKQVGPLEAGRVRTAGARGLGIVGPQASEAVPALLTGLRDTEPYIAMEAASALAKIGKASVPGLINALVDKNSTVRHAATYGLGEAGSAADTAVPALIAKLDDPDLQVRSSTAYSLMQIGYPAVIEMSNIVDHADANAREAAVREFTRFYRSLRSMVPPLVKMAKAEQPALRRQALQALGAMRASDDSALYALVIGLRDPALEVRMAALQGLSLIPWRVSSVVKDLAICLHDTSPKARGWAVRLLGSVGPPAKAVLPDLERCLQDNEASVRSAASDAIEQIDPGQHHGAATRAP